MRCLHVVPHLDEEAAGPSYSVPKLCEALARRGNSVTISCLASQREFAGVSLQVHPSWRIGGRFGVSPRHSLAMRRDSRVVDVVHSHSLWSMVNVAAGWLVPGGRAKLVVSPRGTLSEWALTRSKHRKRLLWPLQRRALERADLLHATSDQEFEDIRRAGLRAPVLVAPNGIDLPLLGERRHAASVRSLLFLSRLHPVKGIENLLSAWAELEERYPDWCLKVVGPGEPEYVASLMARTASLGMSRVEFGGPLYGDEKVAAYQAASIFVLPSHSENFGMAVAEALANECPVVVGKGAPWSGLEREDCGWWVANDPVSLREALAAAMMLSDIKRRTMGERGRAWMARDFSWDSVAESFEAAYRWVSYGGPRPLSVRI